VKTFSHWAKAVMPRERRTISSRGRGNHPRNLPQLDAHRFGSWERKSQGHPRPQSRLGKRYLYAQSGGRRLQSQPSRGDLVGFTVLSGKTSASTIVEMLNGLFSRFDQAASELGIEKIKTIGDCYMAVCGLPKPRSDHAERMARMALRMVEATEEYGKKNGLNLRMRIGLNSGPVVAGVIGTSKFIYDLWGDTVNLASRMESTGVPGQIQVTRSVYERLKDSFEFESRGVIQVKGKGEIETWLLLGEARRVAVSA
jgi:class 3 adenylate cyclase